MRVLILGASGYAGQAIAHKLEENHDVYGTYHTQTEQYRGNNRMFQYELGDTNLVKSILNRIRPQIVISSLRGDFQLQLEAHNHVSNYLSENKDGRIIYISTANVFDARKEKPHYESDVVGSETDYGNFKIKCEQMLQDKLGNRCIIVRIPQIWGKNCPRILKLIEDTRNNIPIVTYPNLFVNFTTDIQIADWLKYIIEENLWGIFHIGTKDTYDYMNFQLEISRIFGLQPVFEKQLVTQRYFQAVLPGRKEIPESLQMKITDVLAFLKKTQNNITSANSNLVR